MDINNVASYLTLDPSQLMRAQRFVEQGLNMFNRDDELTESYLKEHLGGKTLEYAMHLLDETTTSYMGVQIHNQGGKFSAPTAGVYGASSRPELKAKIKEKVLKKNERENKAAKLRKEELELQEKKMSKAAHKKAAKAGKRWQDSDGDGKWYEPGEDVKKEEYVDEALTGDRYKKAVKKPGGTAYSRMVSADPKKRATRGGRGGESDFGAGDRGAGNKAARRSGTYQEEYVDEATAMAKRGHDETAIRNKIAKSTGGGQAADRATKLADKPTFGNDKAAKQRSDYARKQRGDFRNTTSSSPGLHGYGHKSDDPKVKAKQAARGAQRGALTPNEKKQLGREEFENWVNELVEEGYDLSEYTWDEIYEFYLDEAMSSYDRNRKRAAQRAAARNAARDQGKTGAVPGVGYVTPRRERETYTDSSGVERHKSGARMPKKEEFEDILEIFVEEFIDEGYHEDDIFEAFEDALTEATVTYGHDTEKPYEKNTSTRRLVKAVGRLARKTLKKKGAELKQKATAKYQEKKSGLKKKIGSLAQRVADRMKEDFELDEVAPPGDKYERMVKHIKKGYSKGGLTDKERSIAYATAWKAKKNEETECPKCSQDPCECDLIEQFHLLKDYLFENEIAETEEDVLEVFENITDDELDYCLEQALIQVKGKKKGNVIINPEVKKVNESDEQKNMQLQKRQLMLNKQKVALQQKATSQKKPVDMQVEENLHEVDVTTRANNFGAEIENTNIRRKKEKKALSDFRKLSMGGSTKSEEVEYVEEKDDPCWKNYTQVGMKKKGGREVPNCVPSKGVPKAKGYKKEELEQIDELRASEKRGMGSPEMRTSSGQLVGTRGERKRKGEMGGRHFYSGGQGGAKTERGVKKNEPGSQQSRMNPSKPSKAYQTYKKRQSTMSSRFD